MDRYRECPFCSGTMYAKPRLSIDRIPGTPQVVSAEILEWICPDCDYFEEVEGESDARERGAGG